MDIAGLALRKRTLSFVLTIALAGGGIYAYGKLGRLEDPDFTIKTALVTTAYPGATPLEVEQEVTDRLELAIQRLGQVEEVRSISRAGLSIIFVDAFDTVRGEDIPQAWDELRRKVGDAQAELPPGAGPSSVNDDWGDVYGVFFALSGEGFTYREIEESVKMLRRELLLVDGVARIDVWGLQPEVVYVEISRAKMTELGVSPREIFAALEAQNAVVPAGQVHTDERTMRIESSGAFQDVEAMRSLLIRGYPSESLVRLGDVAEIRRGYLEPPATLMEFDGRPALGLGISTVEGGNVVDMGEAVQARLAELESEMPIGMELGVIAFQSETVTLALRDFQLNLLASIVIVIALLLAFMGLRSGLIIGSILLLDILGTMIVMMVLDVTLQRISLGALIVAMGMLVDNAIVVTEGALVNMQKGMERIEATRRAVTETMWPLLGATLVAILAFAAVSLSPDSAGEFLSSLFQVLAISLLLSWILAVTLVPLFCVKFLKIKSAKGGESDPYDHHFFRVYRRSLAFAMHHRFLVVALLTVLMVASVVGFGFIDEQFFPQSARPQFMVDYWRSEGTDIRDTARDVREISQWIQELEHVESVTSFIGSGGLRFILTYEAEMPATSYAQLLVTVDDQDAIDGLLDAIGSEIRERYPDGQAFTKRFELGPGGGAKIEARFIGPDTTTLRRLADEAIGIMRAHPNSMNVRTDWRQRVPVVRARYAEAPARRAGVTRRDLNQALQLASSGSSVGLYREGDELLPIIARLPESERRGVDDLREAQIWSSATGRPVPIASVTEGLQAEWEDPLIRRRDRRRSITAQCDAREGVAEDLRQELASRIEAIELPPGYSFEWGGEFEASSDANEMLFANVPLCFLLMILIVVALFDSIRQPIIVFLTVPLSIIGVAVGLLVTNQPFGFVATLGFLSLSGMLIKNSVVLIEQIELNMRSGHSRWDAILDAGVSRLRPVTMAAFTTVLGMAPLLTDRMFGSMAVTIMAGLTFATGLTLAVVPVLYATFFNVREGETPAPAPLGAAVAKGVS